MKEALTRNNEINNAQMIKYIEIFLYQYIDYITQSKLQELKALCRQDSLSQIFAKVCNDYDDENLVTSNTLFEDFVNVDKESEFKKYRSLFFHRLIHYLGCYGGSPLKEGIIEYLIDKVDEKDENDMCFYPKEKEIVKELAMALDDDIINKIAFIKEDKHVLEYLYENEGIDIANLYLKVSYLMEEEFYKKYSSKNKNSNSFSEVLKKKVNYKRIDYSAVYETIEKYIEENKKKNENLVRVKK